MQFDYNRFACLFSKIEIQSKFVLIFITLSWHVRGTPKVCLMWRWLRWKFSSVTPNLSTKVYSVHVKWTKALQFSEACPSVFFLTCSISTLLFHKISLDVITNLQLHLSGPPSQSWLGHYLDQLQVSTWSSPHASHTTDSWGRSWKSNQNTVFQTGIICY